MTKTIAVVGLGYVGLPLAVELGKKFRTIGVDLSAEKVACYKQHFDPTGEVSSDALKVATLLEVGTDPAALREADFVIVAVPTPVDDAHQPDFSPLVSSSRSVGQNLKQGAIVVYESTVYPGATEEVCIPILEQQSGKKWKKDFFVGYSPERINPGDKERTVTKIVKVVSGDTADTLATVTEIYGSVITAGVFPASSIKVAEAAKVIENTQRDLNIALMNDLPLFSTTPVLVRAGLHIGRGVLGSLALRHGGLLLLVAACATALVKGGERNDGRKRDDDQTLHGPAPASCCFDEIPRRRSGARWSEQPAVRRSDVRLRRCGHDGKLLGLHGGLDDDDARSRHRGEAQTPAAERRAIVGLGLVRRVAMVIVAADVAIVDRARATCRIARDPDTDPEGQQEDEEQAGHDEPILQTLPTCGNAAV